MATLAGALLLASACEVGVGVDIDVAENGSGTVAVGVSLDRAAADALGDLANRIDLEDLALAGWEVSGPAREADNLLWLRATKPFGSAEELPSILAEIAGPGVFEGFELRRRAEFAEQTWELVGEVDPAAAIPELLDTIAFNEGLRERIRAAAGEDALTRGLSMRLSIDLPGELRSGGGDFTWDNLGTDSPTAPTPVRMEATDENTTAKTLRLVGLAASALFVLALLLNLLGWWYIRRHRKRRERELLARADSEPLPEVPAGVDDDIDWDELSAAEYENLAGDVAAPDDLAVSGAGASAEDWTASLEGAPEEDAAAPAATGPPMQPGADQPEPAGPEPPASPPEAEQPLPQAESLFDAAGTPEAPAAPLHPTTEPVPAGPTPEPHPSPESTEPEPEPQPEPEPAEARPELPPEPEPADEVPVPQPEPDATDEPDTAGELEAEAAPGTADEPEDTSEPDETPVPDDVTEAQPAAAPAAPAGPAPSRALRLVVIGGWGVLFQPADPAGELLIPYVRQAGSTATAEEIGEAYRLATLGRLTPGQLWEACGLAGEPTWTHGPYTGRMTVTDGAADFIRSLLRRGIAVGCVVNDVSEWSWRLRAWTGFESVTPWVVSSDIGIRKPDPGVFEMLRRVSEVPFANCLVIDSDHRTLDAARSLGMSTALFGPRDPDQPAARTAHPAVGDFTDLLRRT